MSTHSRLHPLAFLAESLWLIALYTKTLEHPSACAHAYPFLKNKTSLSLVAFII
jgi:hypothetical protein